MIMDDVSTMVSIKIAHGDLKFCSTHMMFQMMVKFDYIYIYLRFIHYGTTVFYVTCPKRKQKHPARKWHQIII